MEQKNWILDPCKFLSEQEAKGLLKAVRFKAHKASSKGRKVAVRDSFIIDLTLSTGLRVMEIAKLNCGDLFLREKISSLIVRRGKCEKKRQVLFNDKFTKHCRRYLAWKQDVGESIRPDAPLILSSNSKTHMTTRALQKMFKRCAAIAGLDSRFSIHSLRHTYASQLYKASGYNLRMVQKQLGHSQISTTQVYADVLRPDLWKALEKLYK